MYIIVRTIGLSFSQAHSIDQSPEPLNSIENRWEPLHSTVVLIKAFWYTNRYICTSGLEGCTVYINLKKPTNNLKIYDL